MALSVQQQTRRGRLVLARNELDTIITEIDAADRAPVAPPQVTPAPVVEQVAKKGGLASEAAIGVFFANVRGKLWPKLTNEQVAGCVAILNACAGVFPVGWTAYAFATAYVETAYTMQPIHERGVGDKNGDGWDDWFDKYDTGRKAIELGNTGAKDGDGEKYKGRGYVQLTGKANYEKATIKLRAMGILKPTESLVDTPELAKRPDVAAAIMVYGMMEGWFTGKSLRDYIQSRGTLQQFTNARRIINGTDHAAMIGGYAVKFQDALIAAGWE